MIKKRGTKIRLESGDRDPYEYIAAHLALDMLDPYVERGDTLKQLNDGKMGHACRHNYICIGNGHTVLVSIRHVTGDADYVFCLKELYNLLHEFYHGGTPRSKLMVAIAARKRSQS